MLYNLDLNKEAIIIAADAFAAAGHAAIKQVRKYTKEPYICHPREVRQILVTFATRPVSCEQEVAALLHDLVEDTGITLELIGEMFGPVVESLVEGLTDISKKEDGNRTVRKQKDLEHTANASIDAQTIKLADLISNGKDITKHDPDFARVYLHEKAKTLAVCQNADPGLLAEAYRVLNESREYLKTLANK